MVLDTNSPLEFWKDSNRLKPFLSLKMRLESRREGNGRKSWDFGVLEVVPAAKRGCFRPGHPRLPLGRRRDAIRGGSGLNAQGARVIKSLALRAQGAKVT